MEFRTFSRYLQDIVEHVVVSDAMSPGLYRHWSDTAVLQLQYYQGESLRGTLDFCRRNRASGTSGLSRGRDRVGGGDGEAGAKDNWDEIPASAHHQVRLPMSLVLMPGAPRTRALKGGTICTASRFPVRVFLHSNCLNFPRGLGPMTPSFPWASRILLLETARQRGLEGARRCAT